MVCVGSNVTSCLPGRFHNGSSSSGHLEAEDLLALQFALASQELGQPFQVMVSRKRIVIVLSWFNADWKGDVDPSRLFPTEMSM